jgi:uncharacterized protein (TIGR02001 family)
MFKGRVLLAGIALVGAAAAHAGVSVTPTVVSDYDFRGISQTATGPALQASVDYGIGAFHADAWASNIEWGPGYKGSMELDLQADYTFGSDATVKTLIGVVDYTYPSMTDQNTVEPWVTISKNWFSASVHYSNDWFTLGKAWYVEANGTFPIAKSGYSITAHIGNSSGDAWKGVEYTDMAVGVTKALGNFTVGLKAISDSGTRNFNGAYKLNGAQSLAAYGKKYVFSANDRVVLSVTTTLPWAKP